MNKEIAEKYISNGWPVFPCRSKVEPVVRGGVEQFDDNGEPIVNLEKTPYTRHGFKDASTNPQNVNMWWSQYPDAAVGIPTGAKIGAFVLDVDNKPGGANGFEWIAEMEAEHGPLPETLRVETPNSGVHYYFNHITGIRNRGHLGAGIDIRGDGGYVIAAGTKMAHGEYVQVGDCDLLDIADAPDWLIDLLMPAPAPFRVTEVTYQSNDAYVNAAITSELDKLAYAGSGTRNNTLNDVAFNLGQFVGAKQISRHEAESCMLSIVSSWPNLKKSEGTISRGLDAGALQPRVIPEPYTRHDNTSLIDISRILESAKSRVVAESRVTAESVASEREAETEEFADVEEEVSLERPPAFVATPFEWVDPTTLPRREFIYGKHLIRKYVSVTVAPGGVGKSNLLLAESLALVTGRNLIGVKPAQRCKVWSFNSEDPRDELTRRAMACCLHYGIKREDIEGRFFLDTGRERELIVAVSDKNGVTYNEPIIEAVVAEIERKGIDVMIIDPFVSTHSVNENDNGAIDKVAKMWAHIADETNCAIEIVHHLRKVSDREATIEDSRGAVSLLGAARSARILHQMTEDQAAAANISPSDRFSYFGVQYGKANLAPRDGAIEWRHLISVGLGNGCIQKSGTGGVLNPLAAQDHAPVVEKWEWPSAETMVDGMDKKQIDMICRALGNDDYTHGYQTKTWCGYKVANILGVEIEEGRKKGPEKARIERIIDGLIARNILCIEECAGHDKIHPERVVKFVRPA